MNARIYCINEYFRSFIVAYKVVIDAGHGGRDPGAVFQGRQEKDDALNLALAVGDILENNGIDVVYTRTSDVYDTPYEKAVIGNNSDADLFVSIHRNSTPDPNSAEGIETLVFRDQGLPADLARNINRELEALGFVDRGVTERPNLVVLRRTKMPAALIEAGFINSDSDNQRFDAQFENVASAIAKGILDTLEVDVPQQEETLYRVQVGAFKSPERANQLLARLQSQGFPGFVFFQDGYYKVQVGAYANLENAIRQEQTLRNWGYNTYIAM